MEKIQSHKLKNKERFPTGSKKNTSAEEDEFKVDCERVLLSIQSKSRLSTESGELKPQESITESMVGSISEGMGSMIAQRLPCMFTGPQKPPLSRQQQLNQQLWESAMRNNADQVRELLSLSLLEDISADVNSKDFHSVTALHIAASEGFVSVCEALLDYGNGTDLNPRNVLERTPLHLSCIRGHLEMAQLLVRSGADYNVQDFEGNTPLHLAVEQGYLNLVVWLLTKNPDISILNKNSKTPIQCTNNPEIIALLKEYYKRNGVDLSSGGKSSIVKSNEKYKAEPRRILIDEIHNLQERKDGRVGPTNFEILQMLGKGSFGEVFLVQKRDNKQLFAMKVLRKDKVMAHNLIKYAKTERNVLSYIKHPFIVSLNYAFQTPEKLFLILDYCSGGDLGFQISKEKRFDEARTKIYICELVLALEELHKRDIIFRDLKPDNIVLDDEGHAMLTDFGLSKEGIYDNTMTKSFCGSLAYLAPEMIKRQGHGKAVDWYLLGVLLFEMLIGMPPYFSPNRDQLYQNIQGGKLKLPTSISLEARNLLKDLLQRDPTKRLGGRRDAEEVKEHRYFHGISWDAVLRRELKPPVPTRPVLMPVYIPLERIYGDLSRFGDESNNVPGWTFVSND